MIAGKPQFCMEMVAPVGGVTLSFFHAPMRIQSPAAGVYAPHPPPKLTEPVLPLATNPPKVPPNGSVCPVVIVAAAPDHKLGLTCTTLINRVEVKVERRLATSVSATE